MSPGLPHLAIFAHLALGMFAVAAPCAGQSDAIRSQSVTERGQGKSTIAIRDGAILRVRGGSSETLTSSDGDFGSPLVVAADPRGLTLCGTTRGLYVVSPKVTTLDPIALPLPGPVVGILFEPRPTGIPRLWVAQGKALTCLEATRYRASVALEAESGTEWTGLRWQEGKESTPVIELLSESGSTRYPIDAGPAPHLRIRSANGRQVTERGPGVELDAGERLTLELDHAPELRVAWRLRDHHLWRDLEQPEIQLPPGRHQVEVVAMDRDLRRSARVTLQVRVANPTAFQKVPALLGLGGFFAAALAWFALRARRRGTSLWRAVVSAGILTVLALQIVAGIFPHGRGWPFMGYSMYTEVWRENDVLFSPRLHCHLPDGRAIEVDPRQLGYASGVAWQGLTPLVHGGAEIQERALQRARASFPRAGLIGYTIEDRRTRLTSDGPKVVAPRILTAYPSEAFRAR